MLSIDTSEKLLYSVALWGAVLIWAINKTSDRNGATIGLPLSFLLSYTFAHIGGMFYLDPDYDHTFSRYLAAFKYDRSVISDGVELSSVAMVSAVIGFLLAERFLKEKLQWITATRTEKIRSSMMKNIYAAIFIGFFSTLLEALINTLASFTGAQAFIGTIQNLFIIGGCAYIYLLHQTKNFSRASQMTFVFAGITPVLMLITTGILADSVSRGMCVICFYMSLGSMGKTWRLRNFAILTTVIVFGLFVSAIYLQTRSALRDSISRGEAVVAVTDTLSGAILRLSEEELFTVDTLYSLDARLNQNMLIGLAIRHHQGELDDFENGATIGLALLGWIPRVLWPNKPERGGSSFVEKHTGVRFSEGTSIGAGPIFELYSNFGYSGVFWGFIFLGGFLRIIDFSAYRSLISGEFGKFVQFQMVGIVMIAPLIDAIFLVTSITVSILIGLGARGAWSRQIHKSGSVRENV